jgi:hypothetical protein
MTNSTDAKTAGAMTSKRKLTTVSKDSKWKREAAAEGLFSSASGAFIGTGEQSDFRRDAKTGECFADVQSRRCPWMTLPTGTKTSGQTAKIPSGQKTRC